MSFHLREQLHVAVVASIIYIINLSSVPHEAVTSFFLTSHEGLVLTESVDGQPAFLFRVLTHSLLAPSPPNGHPYK